MKRHEVAAIIGAYSRQGYSATAAAGGFWVDSMYVHEFRTMREARRDTQVRVEVVRIRSEVSYRAQLHGVA
jgi:hypothetical protein